MDVNYCSHSRAPVVESFELSSDFPVFYMTLLLTDLKKNSFVNKHNMRLSKVCKSLYCVSEVGLQLMTKLTHNLIFSHNSQQTSTEYVYSVSYRVARTNPPDKISEL